MGKAAFWKAQVSWEDTKSEVVGTRILARERDKREVAKPIVTQEEVPSMKPAVKPSNQSPLYLREWGSQPKRQKVRMRPEPSAGQTGQLRKEPHTAGGGQRAWHLSPVSTSRVIPWTLQVTVRKAKDRYERSWTEVRVSFKNSLLQIVQKVSTVTFGIYHQNPKGKSFPLT